MAQLSGYDTEFVDPPVELQYDCSICLSILRNPQLFNCCGMSFCQGCIKPLIAERWFKCPLCKGDPNPIVPDKRLNRQLSQKDVYCSKKKIGCDWTGLLADLDNHLNADDPKLGDRLKGCEHIFLECLYCKKEYLRGDLEEHESTCPQKPYECTYCKKFTGTMEVLHNKHYGECPQYPIPCTNDCGKEFPRCKLDSHIINDCPLTTVNCNYHYAGCDAWLMRRDLNDHLVKHAKRHASLLDCENVKLLLDVCSLRQDLNTVATENMTCIEMNDNLLEEQDRLLKKTQIDDNELSAVYKHLEAKEKEVNELTKKLTEAVNRCAKASEECKKLQDQCKNKDSVLKTHTTAIKHYREQLADLEKKLDETVLEATKKQSLLERFERKNTTLQTKLADKETELSELKKEMKALKKKQEEELQAVQFKLERSNKIIEEQNKQIDKLRASPIKIHQVQLGGAEWPDPEGTDFNPYEGSGSQDEFVPYTTYHEQRINSEVSQPLPDQPKDAEWIGVSKKSSRKSPVPEPTTTVPPTKNRPMDFSAALKKTTKPGAFPSTPPRQTAHTFPRSFKKRNAFIPRSCPKKPYKLMIRNTPSRGRGVTDDDIIQLFEQFGEVYSIDRNGSNTAVVYDNMASVTKGVVASDRRMLVCGGIILNCTYEKK